MSEIQEIINKANYYSLPELREVHSPDTHFEVIYELIIRIANQLEKVKESSNGTD